MHSFQSARINDYKTFHIDHKSTILNVDAIHRTLQSVNPVGVKRTNVYLEITRKMVKILAQRKTTFQISKCSLVCPDVQSKSITLGNWILKTCFHFQHQKILYTWESYIYLCDVSVFLLFPIFYWIREEEEKKTLSTLEKGIYTRLNLLNKYWNKLILQLQGL